MTAYDSSARDLGTCIVRVCRDCCCGTEAKHPGVDHDGLLARLEVGTRGRARVLRSGCLLACDHSNVVVVTPSPAGRKAGGRPVWLQSVLDAATVDAISAWVACGGPGIASMPESVHEKAFAPTQLAATWTAV
ncbi:hypothetical protein [Terrabacter carboxydivorans]|uniref:(2Fe-2S) ferredoxin domain-containing protein n=1 Tax=Terrabacter carboxydivorans TaxID=619730 RepID=A0ABP5YR55_9MICO